MNSIDDDLTSERLCMQSHSSIAKFVVDCTNRPTGVPRQKPVGDTAYVYVKHMYNTEEDASIHTEAMMKLKPFVFGVC